jgi:hypothetical protein
MKFKIWIQEEGELFGVWVESTQIPFLFFGDTVTVGDKQFPASSVVMCVVNDLSPPEEVFTQN